MTPFTTVTWDVGVMEAADASTVDIAVVTGGSVMGVVGQIQGALFGDAEAVGSNDDGVLGDVAQLPKDAA